jgi:hypothetical protein
MRIPLAVMTIRKVDRNLKTGPLSEFDGNYIHRIATHSTKSCRAVARVDTGFQKKKKKLGCPCGDIQRILDVAFVFLNDTICRDDPAVLPCRGSQMNSKHSGVSFHAAVFHSFSTYRQV